MPLIEVRSIWMTLSRLSWNMINSWEEILGMNLTIDEFWRTNLGRIAHVPYVQRLV
jgi:hypothetical protein